ncbi:MAG TPA: extracellular solute-binding protein, partial [Stellaceae bacterium]|nr:extracellular solute-binding protein [Stellaceae bacterium]
MQRNWTRRSVLSAAAGLAVAGSGRLARAATEAGPVELRIIDVAGNLALTRTSIERFAKENPSLVSGLSFNRAPAPELPAKLRAEQAADRVDIDLVLTGPGALSDGIQQGLWVELLPAHRDVLPDLDAIFHPQAKMMQENFGKGQGLAVAYSPSGPVFEYAPDRVKDRPRTIQDLLAWVKAHPNRFFYARPANSGPGWTWLMGLPYLVGDKDPQDPINGWEKSWAYLKALDDGIEYYPSGTAATMKELGEGSRDMIVSTIGWDINPRVLGVVPKEVEVFVLEGTHWVPDTQFMCIPKGVSDAKVAALLKLMSYMLQPPQQAGTYDQGYFYPGPVVKNVPLSMAPAESQSVMKEFGRPFYDDLVAKLPAEKPLPPDRLVAAFQRWDEQIGGKKTK